MRISAGFLKKSTGGGGDANLSEVRFLEGLPDNQIIALFQEARKLDYEKLMEDVHAIKNELSNIDTNTGDVNAKCKAQIGKLKKRFDDIVAIDFFAAPQRVITENAISDIMTKLKGMHRMTQPPKTAGEFTGKTWVTRKKCLC
jgi:hypothetical protein